MGLLGSGGRRLAAAAASEVAFGHATPAQFEWQTRAMGVAERERELVARAFLPLGARVLELGCADGATLHHLGQTAGAHGIDLLAEKVAFAREHLPNCPIRQASVHELPFADGRFDHAIVRDLIHHLSQPERFVVEARRALAPGRRLDLLKLRRYNLLIFVRALASRVEHGELRSTLWFLTRLLAPRFDVVLSAWHQAFPLHRIVFHHRLGRPALARRPRVLRLVGRIERLTESVVPRAAWAYTHVRGIAR